MVKANSKIQDAVAAMQKAIDSGNPEEATKAFEQFGISVAESVRDDFVSANGDDQILMQRGFRVLTTAEQKYYNKLIEAGKTKKPKETFDSLIAEDGMPETIFETVFKDLTNKHPLLSKIKIQNVKYLTKWILNDHTTDTAVWGEINSEITKEIVSSFKSIDASLYKLSAFTVIPKDMLDLGPVYLDRYIRTILEDAIANGLEGGIVSGTGVNTPIGLDRDIHVGVSVSTETGYPKKTAIKVKSFAPAEYGPLLAKMAVSEKGNNRVFDEVVLVCNFADYLTKVMPATTALNTNGTYTKDIFPFPTTVIPSAKLNTGEAILFLPEEVYTLLGSSKGGAINYSDEQQFIEDRRVYITKLYGNSRAYDNTVSLLLDISELDPSYITVKNVAPPAASETPTV